MTNIINFPRNKRKTLAELACEIERRKTTEKLQRECEAMNALSKAVKERREEIRRSFNATGGLAF